MWILRALAIPLIMLIFFVGGTLILGMEDAEGTIRLAAFLTLPLLFASLACFLDKKYDQSIRAQSAMRAQVIALVIFFVAVTGAFLILPNPDPDKGNTISAAWGVLIGSWASMPLITLYAYFAERSRPRSAAAALLSSTDE